MNNFSSTQQARGRGWRLLAVVAGLLGAAATAQAVQLECKYSDSGRFTIDTASGTYSSSMMPMPYPQALSVAASPTEFVFAIPSVALPAGASPQWDATRTALIKISRSSGEFTQAYGRDLSEGLCNVVGGAKF